VITVRVTAEIKDDRRVVLTLPPEFPLGTAELVVTVESDTLKRRRPRLPDFVASEEISAPYDLPRSSTPVTVTADNGQPRWPDAWKKGEDS
jgi:hypothetical protein